MYSDILRVGVCVWFCIPLIHCCHLSVSGGPQKARGSIIGNINDSEFGISILNATVTDSKSGGRIIKATISNIPRTLGPFDLVILHILLSDMIQM